MKVIIFVLLFSLSLNAYNIPQLELVETNKAEILIFKARSILVKNTFSYIIEWKTVNTTDINLSLIGKVTSSGEIVISEEEYYKNNITLSISNKTSEDIRVLHTYKENYSKPKNLPRKSDESNLDGFSNAFLINTMYVLLNIVKLGVN